MVSQILVNIIHWLEYQRIRLFNFFEPKTWGQLEAWAILNEKTNLSYIENYLTQYLRYGLIWKNTLFRDRLVRERNASLSVNKKGKP